MAEGLRTNARVDADKEHPDVRRNPIAKHQQGSQVHGFTGAQVQRQRSPAVSAAKASATLLWSAMNWLFKEEPSHYSYDDFVKDGGTTWSGVRNPVAQRHLHAVKKGDRVFYYHTGDEKQIVGVAKAMGDA